MDRLARKSWVNFRRSPSLERRLFKHLSFGLLLAFRFRKGSVSGCNSESGVLERTGGHVGMPLRRGKKNYSFVSSLLSVNVSVFLVSILRPYPVNVTIFPYTYGF